MAGFFAIQLLLVTPAAAEPGYVTDQLRLGVHAASDTSDRPFTSISSGDRVEIIEETQYYARVTIPDGREGWVKKNYLLSDKPAVLVLAEVEKARDDALAELETLKLSLADRESRVSAIEKEIIASEEKTKAEQQELVDLRAERLALLSKLDAYSFSVPGSLFFIAAGVSVVAGFLVAWWWFDRRSRSRHGGFRVY
ncbi:MAG: TIGR04211 family SH3 domain-containing protein [Gammaproteobacteria bacterium]|nr:TIGR04211 family SH3 domain-containing protein [Gammaproteobacteria bacterium]